MSSNHLSSLADRPDFRHRLTLNSKRTHEPSWFRDVIMLVAPSACGLISHPNSWSQSRGVECQRANRPRLVPDGRLPSRFTHNLALEGLTSARRAQSRRFVNEASLRVLPPPPTMSTIRPFSFSRSIVAVLAHSKASRFSIEHGAARITATSLGRLPTSRRAVGPRLRKTTHAVQEMYRAPRDAVANGVTESVGLSVIFCRSQRSSSQHVHVGEVRHSRQTNHIEVVVQHFTGDYVAKRLDGGGGRYMDSGIPRGDRT